MRRGPRQWGRGRLTALPPLATMVLSVPCQGKVVMAVVPRRIGSLLVVTLLAGCTKTVYVRVPAVCPQDPYCLGAPGASDAAARRAEFDRRLAASTLDVRVSRYVTNVGYRTTTVVGTRVGPDGYVITAFAPLHAADRITASVPSERDGAREVPLMPLVLSIDKDVALLSPPRDERMPAAAPVRIGPVIAGDAVCLRGATRLRCGRVTATDVGIGSSADLADTDIVAELGDVGAGVVNVCGELVAVAITSQRGNVRIVPLDVALTAMHVTPADLR